LRCLRLSPVSVVLLAVVYGRRTGRDGFRCAGADPDLVDGVIVLAAGRVVALWQGREG
jgi:hypothetical protein